MIDVKVPDIGDFKDVAVIEVLVKPGDTVKVEQSLITVESDKASMEIPSSHAGVVKEIKVKVGDKVNEGLGDPALEARRAAARRPPRRGAGSRAGSGRSRAAPAAGAAPAAAAAPHRRRAAPAPAAAPVAAGAGGGRPRVRHARARRRPRRLLGGVPRRRPRPQDRAGRALSRRSAASA